MKPNMDRVVLEMSLKPFKSLKSEDIRTTCREVFRQWEGLTQVAKDCSILLWVSDGSEILTWTGNLDDTFEWGRYIGFANSNARVYVGHFVDPRRKAVLYTDDPPVFTYERLREVIKTLKEVGQTEYGLNVTVGATFDPGPEFAESTFKYVTHPEVIGWAEGTGVGASLLMVCAWSTLKGDTHTYAGFPSGIPDGTPFGTFLGRQCQHFLNALDFDYIWLSNGFGYSHFGWSPLGENFDGHQHNRFGYHRLAEKTLDFWELFRTECTYPVEVRGTNFSTGIDIASDGVPTLDMYERGYFVAPPPNSPWGALNDDFGLELAGYMSRIAMLPGDQFPFRYYPNDPWFWQNPWWDLYDREPFDIYIPMSVGRINGEGDIQTPSVIQILSIDTEKGVLDERCPMEVVPHIRRAADDSPDQAGLLTWLYPFREYHRVAQELPDRLSGVYFGDWFVRSAINNGLPLNTVLSTDDFPGALQAGALQDTVIVTPTPLIEASYIDELCRFVESGGKVILYGPLQYAPQALLSMLNIEIGKEIDGDFDLDVTFTEDRFTHWSGLRKLRHESHLDGGSMAETLADAADDFTTVQVAAHQENTQRVYALSRALPAWKGGQVAWVRGSLPFTFELNPGSSLRHLKNFPGDQYWDSSILLRHVLTGFGWSLRQICPRPDSKRILTTISRHDNGFIFSGTKPDTTVSLELTSPFGAPLLIGADALIQDGHATYSLQKSFHAECRVFVKGQDGDVITCRERPPFPTGAERLLVVRGLRHADVTIFPSIRRRDHLEIRQRGENLDISDQAGLQTVVLRDITGDLEISW